MKTNTSKTDLIAGIITVIIFAAYFTYWLYALINCTQRYTMETEQTTTAISNLFETENIVEHYN